MNKINKKPIKIKSKRHIERIYIILILFFLSISITSAAQSPYSGTLRSIPGTIQAEDFDIGGEGTAYHDLDSVNQGRQYRTTEGVDIESTTDTGAGYNVGYILSSEWLEYTTTVSTTGTYTIETRVASNGNGGTFHIEFNGIDKTGPMTIPNTGGWQNWQTISKTVTLNSGQQVMKIVMDTDGPTGNVGNLNYIRITSSTPTQTQSPYSGTPRSIPGTIQAEDFDIGGEGIAYHNLDSVNIGGQYRLTEGVDIESTTDTGAGYNVGYIRSSEWLEYTTTVSTTGTYTIETRVASNGNGGTFHIEFNGIDKTGPMTIPNTGGWQNWQTLSKTVTLNSGQQVMKIVMDTDGATGNVGNLNYIRIASSTSTPIPTPTPPPTQTPVVSGAFYVATNGNDANPGTEAQPWRTIQKAANTLTAGQTVYVKSGTYNEKIKMKNSGTASNYITFSVYPGNTVTIDGSGINVPSWDGLVRISGQSYIKISGFRVVNSNLIGIMVTSNYAGNYPTGIVIEKGYISNTASSAILVEDGRNIIIDGNEITKAQTMNGLTQQVGETITLMATDGFDVKNNKISQSRMENINAKVGSSNGKIHHNDISGHESSGIYVDAWDRASHDIEIYDNKVHDSTRSGARGITVAVENKGSLKNVKIYNNIIYNNAAAGLNIAPYSNGPIDNIAIINNIVYNNGLVDSWGGGISVDYGSATNVRVSNNIFSSNRNYQIFNVAANTVITNNLVNGFFGRQYETKGSNYIEGDPQFVNPANADFHPKSTSPTIEKGNSVSAPAVDFEGKSRPSGAGYDIGAYEY